LLNRLFAGTFGIKLGLENISACRALGGPERALRHCVPHQRQGLCGGHDARGPRRRRLAPAGTSPHLSDITERS
jgi:hypothetical protein